VAREAGAGGAPHNATVKRSLEAFLNGKLKRPRPDGENGLVDLARGPGARLEAGARAGDAAGAGRPAHASDA